MTNPKQGISKSGGPMHYSVGALICKDGRYLLIDRGVSPLGFAGVAGHIDEDEDPEESLLREVEEEVGLRVSNRRILFEEELDWNWCSKKVDIHYWYLFECEVEGNLKRNERETQSAGWYTPEEIKELTLEPAWDYWFKKLKII
jgi:8-oxo-dGTP pyrophosphatase MutT (NUDIX family)